MAKTMTFLQLSQEFGGTRFGPFDQVEIRLGADPENSDITLPASLGVAPQHVKVLKQQDDSFILAPADRTASVFYFRAGGGKGRQVTAPTACKSGDSFSLVTLEGPRFFLQLEKDPASIASAAAEADGPGWSGFRKPNIRTEGIVAEIKRRGFAAVFATRLGNMGMRAWQMVKTGQIFSPVYIVSGMLLLSGYLFSFGSCGALYRTNNAKKSYQGQLTKCKDTCGISDVQEGDPTVADLTKNILVDRTWKDVIQQDTLLREAYAGQLKIIYGDPARYGWVFNNENSPYTQLKNQLEGQGLPENLVRTLAFAAARGRPDQKFHRVQDSEAATVCGRGPLGLTYRTAYNLGLAALQPDALVEPQIAESGDVAKQKTFLDETLQKANIQDFEYRDDLIEVAGTDIQGGQQCLYIDGTDDRDDMREVAKALRVKVGANAKGLPGENEGYWIASRLMYLYAHDFRYDFVKVDFPARSAPSLALQTNDVLKSNVDFAVRETAAVMARAAAIPCLARFDRDKKEPPPWLVKTPPQLGQCAILRAYVEYDRME